MRPMDDTELAHWPFRTFGSDAPLGPLGPLGSSENKLPATEIGCKFNRIDVRLSLISIN